MCGFGIIYAGSASPMLSNQHVSDGNRLMKELTSSNLKSLERGIESKRIIAQYMLDLGAEVSFHKFHRQLNQFHPLLFFSSPDSGKTQENYSCSSYGINTVGIIRAPRGDGKEAIVLVTPYNAVKSGLGEALSVGIARSVFSLLTQVTWLAKDVIWLVADSGYGEYEAVAAWLKDYQTPIFSSLGTLNAEMCPDMNNLYELKVRDQSEQFEDTISMYAEASNGQMPNLDLINVVNYLAVHRQGKVAKTLNPQWKFGIPATEYVEALLHLQVHCIIRLIEGVVQSVNNLLEKFHQSFFLYLLTSPSKFVSVGVYMIAFALLIAPLPMVAASLYVDASISGNSSKSDKSTPSAIY
ncbi:hypothetical protein REPUB_Repub09cG0022800 [Reevesia pubescens]